MKYLTILFVLSLSLNTHGQTNGIDKDKLLGCWTDSSKESPQNSKVKIFRPCDYKIFPSSRFRFKMVLFPDFTCSWLYLASNDGHFMKPGEWSIENYSLKIQSLDGRMIRTYFIRKIDDDILILIEE